MRVEWTEEALDRLADLMVTTDLAGQDRLEEAFHQINRILADNPWEHGESRRTSDSRIWFTSTLVVGYSIDPDNDLVVITFLSGLRPSQS